MIMRRNGLSPVMWLIVAAVIIVAIGAIIIMAFTDSGGLDVLGEQGEGGGGALQTIADGLDLGLGGLVGRDRGNGGETRNGGGGPGDTSDEDSITDSIAESLGDTWDVLTRQTEVTEEQQQCNGECGEEARILEVCHNRISTVGVTADQVELRATIENRGSEDEFLAVMRPPSGESQAIVPCESWIDIGCGQVGWQSITADDPWRAEYSSSSTLSGGYRVNNAENFERGYVVQVYRNPGDGSVNSQIDLDVEYRVDAVPVVNTDDLTMIPDNPEDGMICTDVSNRGGEETSSDGGLAPIDRTWGVTVVGATLRENLDSDWTTDSDPKAVVTAGSESGSTSDCDDCVPEVEWDEEVLTQVGQELTSLDVEVVDYDDTSGNDGMGECSFTVDESNFEEGTTFTVEKSCEPFDMTFRFAPK